MIIQILVIIIRIVIAIVVTVAMMNIAVPKPDTGEENLLAIEPL